MRSGSTAPVLSFRSQLPSSVVPGAGLGSVRTGFATGTAAGLARLGGSSAAPGGSSATGWRDSGPIDAVTFRQSSASSLLRERTANRAFGHQDQRFTGGGHAAGKRQRFSARAP